MMIRNLSYLRTKLHIALLVLFIVSLSAYSSFAAGPKVRIGFVNMEKAVAGTKEWKKEFAGFKTNFQKEKVKISVKEKQIKKMFEELKKQGFVLDPKLKKEKEERFRIEKKDFERYVQDKNEEFSRKEKVITERMLQKMVKVIRRIGKEKKVTMILDQKMAIYYSPENDLTDLAIRTYDRLNK